MTIRSTSLLKQWRKMRRAFKRTENVASASIAKGKSSKIFTKKLRKRFTPLKFRNFSSYARRSAAAFGNNENISKQIRRFEKEVRDRLEYLNP